MRVPSDLAFVKIDIDEFFMSGDPEQISQACKEMVPNNKEFVYNICYFLLHHQFVSFAGGNSAEDGKKFIWKVIKVNGLLAWRHQS